ncbi:MAG: chemotaxis protein CheW [Brevinematia bacterium]
MKFVTFSVYNQKYAIDIINTVEVLPMPPYIEIPHSYEFVEGMVDIRGEIIPVINLRKKFGIIEDNKSKSYLVIVESYSKKYGLKVDTIEGVIDANESEISSSQELGEISNEYITSVIRKQNDIFIVIDVAKLVEVKGN